MAFGSAADRSTDMSQSGTFGSARYHEFCQWWQLSIEFSPGLFEPGQIGYGGRTYSRQMGAKIKQFLLQACACFEEVINQGVSLQLFE